MKMCVFVCECTSILTISCNVLCVWVPFYKKSYYKLWTYLNVK